MSMKEKLHTGELYLPNDDSIMKEQLQYLDRLYDFNSTRPTELKKRNALLKEMFAEIGAGALIMPGITIGDHVVVGAGSVVTKDLPSNVIAVGNPCRVLREIGDHEREYYFKDRRIDYARLEDEKREAESFWENNQ